MKIKKKTHEPQLDDATFRELIHNGVEKITAAFSRL